MDDTRTVDHLKEAAKQLRRFGPIAEHAAKEIERLAAQIRRAAGVRVITGKAARHDLEYDRPLWCASCKKASRHQFLGHCEEPEPEQPCRRHP